MSLRRCSAVAVIVVLAVVVLGMLLYSGCKSKKSQEYQDSDNSDALTATEAEQLRQEAEQLRREVEQLRREAEQLRREAEQLKQENARLKVAFEEEANHRTTYEPRPASIGETETSIQSYPDQKKVDTAIGEYSAATSTRKKLKLLSRLDTLGFGEDPAVIVLIEGALQDPDVRVNRAGAELLEGFETVQVLPAIERALNSADEETRELAVAPLANITDPKVVELLTVALVDESEDVRQAAFDSLDEQTPQTQLEVLDVAIRLSYDDVKYEAVAKLEELNNHQALEILLMGLDDPDPDFREEVNQSLDFLIGEEFETYEQGLAWWNENRAKLDEELFPLEEEEK
jgi:outer membrane murein-binding lipoprotein Lpp